MLGVAAQGAPRERIRVVPNGIVPERFANLPARPDTPDEVVLGFIGFVRDWHGLDAVIDALAAQGSGPRVALTVVGEGPARADLERRAASLGLSDRVRFTGLELSGDATGAHLLECLLADCALDGLLLQRARLATVGLLRCRATELLAADATWLDVVVEAGRLGAELATTEKDRVRLPEAIAARVLVLPVRLAFADPEGVRAQVEACLQVGH